MSVFVTVGTTKFDELVKTVANEEFQKLLVKKGFSRLVIQLGNGQYEPDQEVDGLEIEWYRLKPSLVEDMVASKLIISHGGAGCIFEALGLKKPLIVAINEELMNNHQIELADQLAEDDHLLYCTCNKLSDTVLKLEKRDWKMTEYCVGQPKCFGQFIDSVMGFTNTA